MDNILCDWIVVLCTELTQQILYLLYAQIV